MKVLSFNVGYFLGFQSQREWLRRPHRLCIGNKDKEKKRINSLVDILTEETPDIVALQEVDLGSIRSRFTNQQRMIVNCLRESGLEYNHRADTKYGNNTIVSNLPVLQNMSNSIFWREGDANARYLSHGTKRLVHVVSYDGSPTVISVHLSKTSGTRKKQLQELSAFVKDYDEVLLTGDFNVKDREEFEVLTDGIDLDLHIPGKSFSTAYPTYAFDVFLTSKELTINRCEVLNHVRFSDHMPVLAEIQYD